MRAGDVAWFSVDLCVIAKRGKRVSHKRRLCAALDQMESLASKIDEHRRVTYGGQRSA